MALRARSMRGRIAGFAERLRSGSDPTPAGVELLRTFAASYPEALFVEVGANDGDQHDHLQPLIRDYAWRGVMVEPVPYVFERLRRNYGGLERVALENVAIAESGGARPFYHLAPVADYGDEGLPQWYDGIGSFSRAAVVDHVRLIPDIEERLIETEVPCLTFDALCAKHGLEHVDLLVVDTEGYDHNIIASIDFDRYQPALVVYEHYHMPPEAITSTQERMQRLGYRTLAEGFDTWCLRSDADSGLNRLWPRLRPVHPALTVHDEAR